MYCSEVEELTGAENALQKSSDQEPFEEVEGMKRIDPLHQLIQLFSRTALTDKWWVTLTLPVAECLFFKKKIF